MKTKVFFDLFKGYKLFAVWEVDDNDNKIGDYPLFSLGAKKALALSDHLEEFKDYVNMSRTEMENKAKSKPRTN